MLTARSHKSGRTQDKRMGFRRISPFGGYKEDPLSLLYEKDLR